MSSLSHRVFISVGSNIEPETHVLSACETLCSLLSDAVVSPIYQSPAVGMDGPDFLNCVVGGLTRLSPAQLVRSLKDIEDDHGRVRDKGSFSDRTLDLDMLLFDQMEIMSEEFTLPRPEVYTSAFVLQPLVDLAAHGLDPVSGKTWQSVLDEVKVREPECFDVLVVRSLSGDSGDSLPISPGYPRIPHA